METRAARNGRLRVIAGVDRLDRFLVGAALPLCLFLYGCGQPPTGPTTSDASSPSLVLRSQGVQTVSFDAMETMAPGTSVEGLGTVHEYLDIRSLADPTGDTDGDGTRTVLVTEAQAPEAYVAGGETNGCLGSGFSDVEATRMGTSVPHRYQFTFGPGGMARSFSLTVLDHGDFSGHPLRIRLTAFDRGGEAVDSDEHSVGYSWHHDACGWSGSATLEVSGTGIVRVVLEQEDGKFDSGIAFDDIRFELAAADIEVDVQPGDNVGCINNDGNGVIPAVVFSSAAFDATRVDPATLRLDGLEVATRGQGRTLTSIDDVNGDGRDDLLAKFDDVDGTWDGDETEATLTGEASDGTPFRGTDRICLVP